jgi:hypothetical protein
MTMVNVRKYKRHDGTEVSKHTRSDPESSAKMEYSAPSDSDSSPKEKSFSDLTKPEKEVINYKGRKIFVQVFGNATKAYVPFGNNTHIEPTREQAIEGVKKEIDKKEEEQKALTETYKKPFPKFMHFYYNKIKERATGFGGTNVTVKILVQEDSGLKNLGETKWNTASYKGEESEVLTWLKRNGHVPSYMFPTDYYGWSDAEKYNMKISRV